MAVTQTDAYKNQAKTDAERKDWTNHLANQPGYVDQRQVAGGGVYAGNDPAVSGGADMM